MLTRHTHNRRNRNRLLRGRAPRRGGQLTLRQQIGQVLGVEPQVFADARDLTVGDGNAVATWGGVSAVGAPTLDVDGFGGSPEVDFSTSNAFAGSVNGALYAGNQTHVWVATINNPESAIGARCILTVNLDNDNSNWVRMYINEIAENTVRLFYRSNDGDDNENDNADLAVPHGLMHIGVAYDGTSLQMAQLAGGQLHVIGEDVPRNAKDITAPDYATIGVRWGTSTAEYFNGGVALVSMTACSAGAATLANLQSILNLHNAAYPVS